MLLNQLINLVPNCWSMPGRSLVMPLEDQTKRSIFADEPQTLETIVRCSWDVPLPMLTPIESVLMGLFFLGPHAGDLMSNRTLAEDTNSGSSGLDMTLDTNPRHSVAVAVQLAMAMQCDPRLSVLDPICAWSPPHVVDLEGDEEEAAWYDTPQQRRSRRSQQVLPSNRGSWVVGFRSVPLKGKPAPHLPYYGDVFQYTSSLTRRSGVAPRGWRVPPAPPSGLRLLVGEPTLPEASTHAVTEADHPIFNCVIPSAVLDALSSGGAGMLLRVAARYQHKDVFVALWQYCLTNKPDTATSLLAGNSPQVLHPFFHSFLSAELARYREDWELEPGTLPPFLAGTTAKLTDYDFRTGIKLAGYLLRPRSIPNVLAEADDALLSMAHSPLPFEAETERALFGILQEIYRTHFLMSKERGGGKAGVVTMVTTVANRDDSERITSAAAEGVGMQDWWSIQRLLQQTLTDDVVRRLLVTKSKMKLGFIRWLLDLPILQEDISSGVAPVRKLKTVPSASHEGSSSLTQILASLNSGPPAARGGGGSGEGSGAVGGSSNLQNAALLNELKGNILRAPSVPTVYRFVLDHRMRRAGFHAQDVEYEQMLQSDLSLSSLIAHHLSRGNFSAAELFEQELTTGTGRQKVNVRFHGNTLSSSAASVTAGSGNNMPPEWIAQRSIGLGLCRGLLHASSTSQIAGAADAPRRIAGFIRRYPMALLERYSPKELKGLQVDEPLTLWDVVLRASTPINIFNGILRLFRDATFLCELPPEAGASLSSPLKSQLMSGLSAFAASAASTSNSARVPSSSAVPPRKAAGTEDPIVTGLLAEMPHPLLQLTVEDLLPSLRAASAMDTTPTADGDPNATLQGNSVSPVGITCPAATSSSRNTVSHLLLSGAHSVLLNRWDHTPSSGREKD